MKILVCSQYYYPENFSITNICEELVKRGHSVDVVTGKPNYGFNTILPEYKKIREETINGVKVHRVNIKPRRKSKFSVIKNYLSYFFKAKKWVKKCKEKYDIVFSMSLSPVTILAPANLYKKKHNVKHVCYCVDLWPESVVSTYAVKKKSLIYNLLYKWSRSLYSKCDEILISSPSFKSYFENVLKLPYIKTSVVGQTALVENYDETKEKRYDDYFDIFYCGNIGTIQRIEMIPEIMSLVKNKNVKFHIIGLGKNVDKLLENIKKFNVENRVIFHGPMPIKDATPYLLGADATYVSLLTPGPIGDSIPNKLNLYLSFGKPIIGVFKGDSIDVLNGAKGIYGGTTPLEIAQTIDKTSLLNCDELASMGKASRNYYDLHFSLKKVVDKIESSLNLNI